MPYERGVHWMDPHDIDAEEFLRIDANEPPQHNGVIVVATADKAVHSLPLTGDSLDLGELSVK